MATLIKNGTIVNANASHPSNVRRTRFLLWCIAAVWSLVALSGMHVGINHRTLGLVLFMSGLVGGFAMLLITGVHGDFNVAGGAVYCLVNTVVFYWVLRLCRYLIQLTHNRFARVGK